MHVILRLPTLHLLRSIVMFSLLFILPLRSVFRVILLKLFTLIRLRIV